MPRCFEPPPLVQAVLNALLSVLAAAVALHAVRIPKNFVSEGSDQPEGAGVHWGHSLQARARRIRQTVLVCF